MNTEPNTIADDQVRSAFQRWKNLEEEKARISEDLKELFAEQKASGHDTKAMRAAFRLKVKMDEASPEDAEHEALVDTYLAALEAPRASRAYARENIEEFPASVGSHAAPSSLTTREAEESVVSVSEKATVATQGEATAPTSDERVSLPVDDRSDAAVNAEGTDVESSALRAGLADPTSNTGEGAANTALPADGVILEYVPPRPMKRLPFAHCFPELSKAEYERLEKDIAANRVREPIIRQGDVIVDGWARYNICRTLGISYPIKNYSGDDMLLDVIEWQRASRNFTTAQEKKIAADLAKEIPHRADDIMAAFGLAEALEAAE